MDRANGGFMEICSASTVFTFPLASPEHLHKYYVTKAYGFFLEAIVPRGLNFFR